MAHLLCVSLGVPPCVPLNPLPTLCTAPMDIALVLDSSSSATDHQGSIRELASQFLSLFELSASGPRATVIAFDSSATNIVESATGTRFSTDADVIKSALASFIFEDAATTITSSGFEMAQAAFDAESRTSVVAQRFVLLLADAKGDETKSKQVATALKDDGMNRGLNHGSTAP